MSNQIYTTGTTQPQSFCTFTSILYPPPLPLVPALIPPVVQRSSDYTPPPEQEGGVSSTSLYKYNLSISNQTTTQSYSYLDPRFRYFALPLPGALGQDLVDAVKKGCNVTDPDTFSSNLLYTPALEKDYQGVPADAPFTFGMAFFLPQSAGQGCVEEAIKTAEHLDVKCVANETSVTPQRRS